MLSSNSESSVRFRESVLSSEGGIAHLEISIDDIDTDTKSVIVDLSSIGMGLMNSQTRGFPAILLFTMMSGRRNRP